jgi:hypothetical protein
MNIDFDTIKRKYTKSYDKFIKDIAKVYNKKFTFCYCDIEEFFDENNIHIVSDWTNGMYFCEIKYPGTCYYGNDYDTRPESQSEAIYKAFEIMEASS